MAKIIVIDDDPALRKLLKDGLAATGHDIFVTMSFDEALAQFRQDINSLIITDLVMPDKNGIDLIMQVKKEYEKARIIAISGGGDIEGRFDYLAIAKLVGAGSVMKKPFSLEELRTRVTNMLASAPA